ncbi:hypothetical protein JTB14_024945 [Gonioctena quinquepunctata]|nr:hypothetical protein JTB14_024945 [Gonioctena quinquepunctata]
MKFMKKTKQKVEKEMEDSEGQAMYSSEITEEMRRTGNLLFITTSMTNCKNLIDGRLSFGGMNPEIEKLMMNDYAKLLEGEERRKEKDITDAEMAEASFTFVPELVWSSVKSWAEYQIMQLSQVRCLVFRLTVPQNQNAYIAKRSSADKLVPGGAILLAGLGVGLSSFSLKQMMSSKRPQEK